MERQLEAYRELLDDHIDANPEGFFAISRAWELRHDFFLTLQDILTAVTLFRPVSTTLPD